jgi:hypothetical protein
MTFELTALTPNADGGVSLTGTLHIRDWGPSHRYARLRGPGGLRRAAHRRRLRGRPPHRRL